MFCVFVVFLLCLLAEWTGGFKVMQNGIAGRLMLLVVSIFEGISSKHGLRTRLFTGKLILSV